MDFKVHSKLIKKLLFAAAAAAAAHSFTPTVQRKSTELPSCTGTGQKEKTIQEIMVHVVCLSQIF